MPSIKSGSIPKKPTRATENGESVNSRTSQPSKRQLHPPADVGEEVRGPEQPVAAVAECLESAQGVTLTHRQS